MIELSAEIDDFHSGPLRSNPEKCRNEGGLLHHFAPRIDGRPEAACLL
jgi:hypothetical protein